MKRDALLDCLDTARDCYCHAWARTSVDIAIQVHLELANVPRVLGRHFRHVLQRCVYLGCQK